MKIKLKVTGFFFGSVKIKGQVVPLKNLSVIILSKKTRY